MVEIVVYLGFVAGLVFYIRMRDKKPNLWGDAFERISWEEYGKENCLKWRSEKK